MVDRGRMLRESVRRDLSDRSAGGWEPDVPPGTASDAGSGGGGMPVPDYESEDGRMRPWAGLDDDDAAADYSGFDGSASDGPDSASDDVDDPAAVAAANAGRRLSPAPTSARAIAAANAAGVVRATAPGQSWAPPVTSRSGSAQAAAEAAADAAVPRADRLRLHPEYVAATADDYAHLVRSHDWRRTLGAVKEEARRRGRLEVSVLDVGCGAGAFTAALAASGALLPREPALLHDDDDDDDEAVPPVPCSFRVDLLDPSPRALRAAAASLVPPLALGELRCASVQDFARAALTGLTNDDVNAVDAGSVGSSGRGTYDVVWAVHTTSHVPCGINAGYGSSLASFLKSLRDLLRPGGFGFIAAPTNDSHYARFHALYRREFGPGSGFDAARIGDPSRPAKPGFNGGDPTGGRGANNTSFGGDQYTAAEHVAAALAARGVAFNRVDVSHVTRVNAGDGARLEAYLRGCAGDDAVSLDTMLANPRIGAYLASCRSADGSHYAFPQKTAHITL